MGVLLIGTNLWSYLSGRLSVRCRQSLSEHLRVQCSRVASVGEDRRERIGAGDVTDLDEESGGARGADAVQVEQAGAGRGHELGQFPCSRPSYGRRAARGRPRARRRPACGSCRPRRGYRRRPAACGPGPRRGSSSPHGNQLQQQSVQLADPCGCALPRGRGAGRPAAARPPASCSSATTGRSPVIRVPTRATEWASVHRSCVPAGYEHTCPGGQLRRHIDDLLAVGDQPVRDVPADPFAALDGPDPVRSWLGSPASRDSRPYRW